MITTEKLTINGKGFVRTFSDLGFMVEREGIRYEEAIDPAELGRTYVETDEPVQYVNLTETEQKALAYDIIRGVAK